MISATFTHANLKKPMEVVLHNIFSYYYSESAKCTHLISIAGTVAPVVESVEYVKEMLERSKKDGR